MKKNIVTTMLCLLPGLSQAQTFKTLSYDDIGLVRAILACQPEFKKIDIGRQRFKVAVQESGNFRAFILRSDYQIDWPRPRLMSGPGLKITEHIFNLTYQCELLSPETTEGTDED